MLARSTSLAWHSRTVRRAGAPPAPAPFLQLAPFQAMPCPRPARRHQNRPGVLDVCPLALASSRCCGP